MSRATSPPLFPWLPTVALAAGGIALLLGSSALLGWAGHVNFLKGLLPGAAPMNPTSGVTFLLAGLSLILLKPDPARGWRQRLGQALAVLVVLAGLLKVGDYVF